MPPSNRDRGIRVGGSLEPRVLPFPVLDPIAPHLRAWTRSVRRREAPTTDTASGASSASGRRRVADGRMLRRSIATNEQLARVSLEAAFVFTWCLPFLDVEGRMYGSPLRVKALAFPVREEISISVIERALAELHSVGLVSWYEAGGEKCLAFPGFLRNNTVRPKREGRSKIPAPPSTTSSSVLVTHNAGTMPGSFPESARSTPAERKSSERKVTKEKRTTHAAKLLAHGAPFNFGPFVDGYRARFDADPDKKDAVVLKALVAKHGHDEVLARWIRFLAVKGTFGVNFFRRTWADWAEPSTTGRVGVAERMYDLLTTHGLLTADKDVFIAEVGRLCEAGVIRDHRAFMNGVARLDLRHLGSMHQRHFAVAYIEERLAAAHERKAVS